MLLRGRQMAKKKTMYLVVSFKDQHMVRGELVYKKTPKIAFVTLRNPGYLVGSHPHPCLTPVVIFTPPLPVARRCFAETTRPEAGEHAEQRCLALARTEPRHFLGGDS